MPTTFALVAFVLLTYFTGQETNRLLIAGISVLFGTAIPFSYLFFLFRRQKVSDIDVPIREQRTIPYLVSVLFYFVGFLVLYILNASVSIYALMFCYATNTFIISLINTQWKISAHAMGAAGPLTVLAIVFGWKILPAFLLIIIVSWARVELKAHTKAQVTAGALLGIFLTAVQVEAFYKFAGGR
ncbi:MAG: PAP2 family protein [Bacteroidetes bacterium]|nr:PAP2 family protein [Bacteroidota bacterium]